MHGFIHWYLPTAAHWNSRPTVILQKSSVRNHDFTYRSLETGLIKLNQRRHNIFEHQDFPGKYPLHPLSIRRLSELNPYPPLFRELTSFYKFGFWDDLSKQHFWWPSKREREKLSGTANCTSTTSAQTCRINILESQPKLYLFVYQTLLLT